VRALTDAACTGKRSVVLFLFVCQKKKVSQGVGAFYLEKYEALGREAPLPTLDPPSMDDLRRVGARPCAASARDWCGTTWRSPSTGDCAALVRSSF
jgi:hypothetical protein